MQIARFWRQQPSSLRLEGSRCPRCDELLFPQRIRCPGCGSSELETYQFSGRGTVLTLTTVYEAPLGFAAQVPYVAALIRLVEGPVITAMLTDIEPGQAAVGLEVEMVTRRILADGRDGPIVYGYKFAPAGEVPDDRR
jgi:uncharacterized OB-fold protein